MMTEIEREGERQRTVYLYHHLCLPFFPPALFYLQSIHPSHHTQAANVWTLPQSVWAPRLTDAESLCFYDTTPTLRKAFDKDWRRTIRKSQFQKLIGRVCHDDDEEVAQIREEVFQDYATIASCFHFYAACSSGGGFQIKLNAFSDFLDDCLIPEEAPSPCNQMALDTLISISAPPLLVSLPSPLPLPLPLPSPPVMLRLLLSPPLSPPLLLSESVFATRTDTPFVSTRSPKRR